MRLVILGENQVLQQAAYHAAKGGVNTLTRALALEWVSYGITVNTISPGWINTGIDDAFFEADPANLELVLNDTPMHRLGNPIELIGTAIYLSSDSASFVTGQNIKVDGGYTSWWIILIYFPKHEEFINTRVMGGEVNGIII